MGNLTLNLPAGYDPATQAVVGHFAAALDDQLALLKEDIAGLTAEQFSWQPHPGMNSIGMLLAHVAIVEVYWLSIAWKEVGERSEWDATARQIVGLGLDDDGMPAPEGGRHPEALAGKGESDYMAILDKARAATHEELKKWTDADLARTYKSSRDRVPTRGWTLYHALEHFSGHYGQVLLLKHLMRRQ